MRLTKNLWLLLILPLVLSIESLTIHHARAQGSRDRLAQPAQPTAASTIGTIAEQAVGLLGAQQYEAVRVMLHPDLRESISAEEIQQQWQELLAEQGAFRRIVNARPAQLFDGSLVLVTTAFERGSEDLIVLFDDQQQIVGFDILQLHDNIQAIAEGFVDALAAGDYALARRNFHSSLKSSVFPADLASAWQSTQAANGQFQRRLSSQVTRGVSADVVQVSVEFGGTTHNIIVAFKSGRIAGFDLPQAELFTPQTNSSLEYRTMIFTLDTLLPSSPTLHLRGYRVHPSRVGVQNLG